MTDTTAQPWPSSPTTPPTAAEPAGVGGPPTDPDGSGPVPVDPGVKGNSLRLVLMVVTLAAVGVFAGWSWLVIIGAVVASIFLHELGHYAVAKWAGMKVTEFFIGFGPRLWSFKRGETEYGIKAIPAGAYVRIIGMSNLEPVDPADEDRTYRSKPYRKRLPVILAGPFANFAIALVLLFVVLVGFGVGQPNKWTVGTVVPGSAAAAAGFQSGDRVVSFDGKPTGSWSEFTDLIQPTAGQPVDVVVERGGVQQTLTATLGWRLSAEAASALAPLQEGDQIVSLNGDPVPTYEALSRALADAPSGTATLVFEHNGSHYTTELPVPIQLPAHGYTGFLGVGSDPAPAQRMSPVPAVGESFSQFGSLMVTNVEGIGKLFSPSGLSRYWDNLRSSTNSTPAVSDNVPAAVPVDGSTPALKAPVPVQNTDRPVSIIGIAQLGSAAVKAGPVFFLEIMIVLNSFLGLINLVPLPPFDGGHATVATYEAIRGKIRGRVYRIDMAKLMPVAYATFAFLALFGLSAMYLDLAVPITNPYGR